MLWPVAALWLMGSALCTSTIDEATAESVETCAQGNTAVTTRDGFPAYVSIVAFVMVGVPLLLFGPRAALIVAGFAVGANLLQYAFPASADASVSLPIVACSFVLLFIAHRMRGVPIFLFGCVIGPIAIKVAAFIETLTADVSLNLISLPAAALFAYFILRYIGSFGIFPFLSPSSEGYEDCGLVRMDWDRVRGPGARRFQWGQSRRT
eukprot:TRINITY_DN5802_c0_g1_i1.p1 TRINITY_DN5802_c0_g1~~TRINITY_DN5802_c0_g1_i1.p1  ORF type:complete len:219 (-),score=24.91 TRINITY_DN5802_c0_g1_i1:239-862(-)